MKWTNKYGIAPEIAEAIITRQGEYKMGSDYSVTSLLTSPRQFFLALRHNAEIEQDVSDSLASWEGHLIHDAVEMDIPRRTIEVLGKQVSGKPDFVQGNTIKDYKTTSVWSAIYKSHLDKWTQQLNIYALLEWEVHGTNIENLLVEAYLTDWQRGKAREAGYPPVKQFPISIEVWDHEQTRAFLDARVKVFNSASDCVDDDLPFCTDDEMWARPTTYAVMKLDGKRAQKVCATLEEAQNYIIYKNDKSLSITERLGRRTKCEDYCPQGVFCNQWHDAKQSSSTTSSTKSEENEAA